MGYTVLSTKTKTKMGGQEIRLRQHGETTDRGFSVVKLVLACVMLAIGVQYMPDTATSDQVDSIHPSNREAGTKPSDPCPNGAAYYLYLGGIISLVTCLLNVVIKISTYLAKQDGKISCGEKCGLGLLSCTSSILVLVDLVLTVWGSVVVFSQWSSWTDSYQQYADSPHKYNYCANLPMVFAFVILLVNWVMTALMFLIACCCCCWGCAQYNSVDIQEI